jgi:hypothetical protein
MANAAELFRAIGLATCSWSRLETQIDMVLIYLNRPRHSLALYDRDHPIGFRSKIKLLKRWFNQHPALANGAISLRQLTPKILELNQQRNSYLHSVLQDFDPLTKVAIWGGIKAAGSETYKVGRHIGSVETLIAFATEAHLAHVEFARIGRELFGSGMIEQLQKHGQHTPHPVHRSRQLRADLVFGRPRRDTRGSSRWGA